MRYKKFLKVCLGTLYVLCLGELFVRAFVAEPIVPRFVTGADYGVRTNIAGARYRHYTKDVNVEYRINGAGFRADTEYSQKKPADTCRILMFGDSFMMGYEVDIENSIPYALQEMLLAAGKQCEVINMAVSGFGTAEMLLALEKNGLAYEPDAVVFQWHRTDFQDNVRAGLYKLEDRRLERNRETYLPAIELQDFLLKIPVYRFLIQYSQLYSAARDSLARQTKRMLVQLRRATGETVEDDEGEATVQSEAEELATSKARGGRNTNDELLAAKLLQRAADLARSRNARFYVLDLPEKLWDGHVRTTITRLNADDLTGIPVVRVDDALNSLLDNGQQIFYENGHGHFTPLGYVTVARVLFDVIDRDLEFWGQ